MKGLASFIIVIFSTTGVIRSQNDIVNLTKYRTGELDLEWLENVCDTTVLVQVTGYAQIESTHQLGNLTFLKTYITYNRQDFLVYIGFEEDGPNAEDSVTTTASAHLRALYPIPMSHPAPILPKYVVTTHSDSKFIFLRSPGVFFIPVKHNGVLKQKLIGYNQLWLGCPPQLCLGGSLDAVTIVNQSIIIFKRHHYWQYPESEANSFVPTVYNARRVPYDKMSAIDAAMTIAGNIHFIKNTPTGQAMRFIGFEAFRDYHSRGQPLQRDLFRVSAAAGSPGGEYVFTDTNVRLMRNNQPVSVPMPEYGEGEKPGVDADAAVFKDQKLHVFKDTTCYLFDITDPTSPDFLEAKSTLTWFFKCSDEFYVRSGFTDGYETFSYFIERFYRPHTREDWTNRKVIPSLQTRWIFVVMITTALALEVAALVIYIGGGLLLKAISIRRKKRRRQRKSAEKSKSTQAVGSQISLEQSRQGVSRIISEVYRKNPSVVRDKVERLRKRLERN